MTTVATLDTVMRLNSTAFRQGMVDAAATANKSLASIQTQAKQTASVLLSLKRAADAVGSFYLLKEGIGSLIQAQQQLQAIDFTFQAATGSAERGAQAFDFVRQVAEKVGLSLPEAAEGFAKLSASATAAGVSMEQQQSLFDAYAKASAVMHLSTTQSNRALLALEQMFAKGNIQAQELRLQLGQAIPGAAQRFQNAVLEATKGTDLAGKSFEQLLVQGKLVTSKFTPELVQALTEVSQGGEGAFQSLQSQLGRVSTAWFNLKSQVSSGLFNDAVTGGAKLLADEMANVANAFVAIAGIGIARVIGGQLNNAAGAVQRFSQQNLGANMAADSEVAYQRSLLASAEAEAAAATSAKALLTMRIEGATAALADAQQTAFDTQVKLEAAQATLAYTKNALVMSATVAAERDATIALAAAEADMAKAKTAATAATAALEKAETESLAIKGRLIAANEALAAAQARVATAQAVQTETAAMTSLAGVVGKAATSFGRFAMTLVGGPWGVAALAVGGLAYSIYDLYKKSEQYRAETDQQVKSLQQLAQSARDAAAAYGTLGDRQTASQVMEQIKSGNTELANKQIELAKLEQQANELQQQIAVSSQNSQGAMGANIGGGVFTLLQQNKLDNLNDRITKLKAEMGDAEQGVATLSGQMSGAFAPAIDKSAQALQKLIQGGSLSQFMSDVKAAFADVPNVVAAIEKSQQQANAAITSLNSLQERAHKVVLTKGVGYVAQAKAELQVGIEGIKAQKLTIDKQNAAIAQLQSQYNAALPDLKGADIADNAKKVSSAINAQKQEYEGLIATINARIEQDKAQIDGSEKLTAAEKLQITTEEKFKAGKTKLSAAMQANIEKMLAAAVAQGKLTQATLLQQEADKRLADLQSELATQAQQQQTKNARLLEGIGKGDQWNQQHQAIEQITDDYTRMLDAENKAYAASVLQHGNSKILADAHAKAIKDITSAEQDAIAAQNDFFAKQAEETGNWMNGFNRAVDNFKAQQRDQATIAEQFTNNLIGGFGDAFVQFATGAESAKKAFGDFIDQMFAQALKVVANKAIMALFDSFGVGQQTPGTTAGGMGSWFGNFMSLWGNIGGKAAGGAVAPYSINRVAENGAEVLKMGGNAYLMTGAQGGEVIPNNRVGSGVGGNVVHISVAVPPTYTRQSAEQVALAIARKQSIAARRTG